ncbi:MAG TPA: outer membrane protein assembly factor BamD [Polyangiaceae bacterium]|jgi:outer membrane protein assembly factor BamD|nr:outer membrane protein assembly factor BamD [Polyangiaceae bacterium]
MRAVVAALMSLPAFGALGACGSAAPESRGALNYSEDAKRAYDKAMVAFEEHDWEKARALFKEVKRKYSYSRYARLAELRLADTDVSSEKLSEAIQGYRSFVHDHRTDPEVPYARFRICKSLFEQISDGGFLLPPLEERDQATSGESYREISNFVKDYPTGPYSKQTRYMLSVVTGRLVRHELYVANYYLKRDEFDAAVARAQYVLRTYSGSGLEPEAMVLLGETYLKMHKGAEARTVFKEMLAKYPAAPFSAAAQNFLLEMDRQGK